DSNFILIQAENPKELYKNLVQKGIVIRDRTKYIKDGLRITIGTKEENKIILEELSKIRIGESI
ncbi:MAG: histidinol-phosphate transaminase, partial [Saprospiraceae bacterium]